MAELENIFATVHDLQKWYDAVMKNISAGFALYNARGNRSINPSLQGCLITLTAECNDLSSIADMYAFGESDLLETVSWNDLGIGSRSGWYGLSNRVKFDVPPMSSWDQYDNLCEKIKMGVLSFITLQVDNKREYLEELNAIGIGRYHSVFDVIPQLNDLASALGQYIETRPNAELFPPRHDLLVL